MKQDRAESQAVANAEKLPYGLRKLPVVDVPQLQCLAPDFEIAVPKPKRFEPAPQPVGEWAHLTREQSQKKLASLRDEFARKTGNGYFKDAADAAWFGMPMELRTCLMRVAGIHAKTKIDLEMLANRNWREMPDTERESISRVVRKLNYHLPKLTALAARV